MPPERDTAYLLDIFRAAKLIQVYAADLSQAELESDQMRLDAIIRRFEIIGEATKRLSSEFKTIHPNVPWKMMAGMRDMLIHDYDDVAVDRIWNSILTAIPDLLVQIEPLIPSDEST